MHCFLAAFVSFNVSLGEEVCEYLLQSYITVALRNTSLLRELFVSAK